MRLAVEAVGRQESELVCVLAHGGDAYLRGTIVVQVGHFIRQPLHLKIIILC